MKKLLQQKSFFFDKTVAISLRQVKSPEKQTNFMMCRFLNDHKN